MAARTRPVNLGGKTPTNAASDYFVTRLRYRIMGRLFGDQDQMMLRAVVACALLASTVCAAAAQEAVKPPPFRAIDYPIEIRKALSYGPEECKRQGGGKVTFAPHTVRKVDLNATAGTTMW